MKKLIFFLVLFSLLSIASFGMEQKFTSYISYHMNKDIGISGVYGLTLISDETADSGIRIEMNIGHGIQGFNKDAYSFDLWSDITMLMREKVKWLWRYFSVGGKVRIHPGYGSYGLLFGMGLEVPISKFFVTSGFVLNILSKDSPQESSGIILGAGFRF